ncbi:putative GRINL1B complex locus protein 2 [Mactra antiquata]
MAKAFYPTNEGHVGNLEKLTTVEIAELLKRQENILQKRSFVAKLPDKGEKIKSHITQLQNVLAERDKLTCTDNRNLKGDQAVGKDKNGVHSKPQVEAAEGTTTATDSQSSLEESLKQLSLQGSGDSGSRDTKSHVPKHQYEIALERYEKNILDGMRQPIKLNRDLKIVNINELPDDILKNKPAKVESNDCMVERVKVPEESAVIPPQYKHCKAQTLDLQESLMLQQTQKQVQERLNAEIAAQKLSERFEIKTEDYNPEGVDMSYRVTGSGRYMEDENSDDDSDGDNDDNNYPLMRIPSDTED